MKKIIKFQKENKAGNAEELRSLLKLKKGSQEDINKTYQTIFD